MGTSITKQLKFEDLGLAPMENGYFQCLACSKEFSFKTSAVRHYKSMHVSQNQSGPRPTVQCPRCMDEILKASLNSHMDQKHGVKKFDQMMKMSFKPDAPAENMAKDQKYGVTNFNKAQSKRSLKPETSKIIGTKNTKKKIKTEKVKNEKVKTEKAKTKKIKNEKITEEQIDYNNNNIVKTEAIEEDSKMNIKKELIETPMPSVSTID